ncbi:cation:proton antiporter [Corynebacterium tapiri]|uniref:Cation:proton antiporter n=1 Tax=Corynebacterium tapiri TaxID=1448266 RepID=A0A5C4U468_9CORY|nr:cation:proton antiporter [Corynebacterium tapiri]TNL97370.1 cation:proton antiporter [Corynebacterium tapiri]
MSAFEWILLVCMITVGLCLLAGLALILLTKDILSRAVLSDMLFYAMVCFYLIWTIRNDTFIAYEIAILAGLVGGVMPTLSMSRVVSRGRR